MLQRAQRAIASADWRVLIASADRRVLRSAACTSGQRRSALLARQRRGVHQGRVHPLLWSAARQRRVERRCSNNAAHHEARIIPAAHARRARQAWQAWHTAEAAGLGANSTFAHYAYAAQSFAVAPSADTDEVRSAWSVASWKRRNCPRTFPCFGVVAPSADTGEVACLGVFAPRAAADAACAKGEG